MLSVLKKELNQFFSNLTGYIAIILFLLVNGIFLFVLPDSSIFESGYANLDKFFDLAPWVLVFLLPAISMRAMAEEYKSGTIEILQTKPLTPWEIVLGKYLSILTMLVFSILPTLLYVVTIKCLSASGSIDAGGIAGSFLGLLLLGAVFAAISLCFSAVTNNAVVAFLLSAFACIILYFGFSAVSHLPVLQGNGDYYMEMLGIDFHYRSISKGVLDSRDLVYFFSLVFFFLFLTTRKLVRLGLGSRTGFFYMSRVMLVFFFLVGINFLATLWHTRIDLTDEKRFTLSNATKKLLRKLDEPVTAEVFLKGNYPSGFKKLSASTNDMLNEFRELAGNKVQYTFISPDEIMEGTNVKYQDTLSSLGLYPINLTSQLKEGQQQQFVFPVALLHYKDRSLPVTLYQGKTPLISYQELNSAEAMLEYKLADGIARLTQKEKPVIGYATGNGEPVPGEYRLYDLVENVLRPDYNFFTLDLEKQPMVPKPFDALMVVKPSIKFSEEEKLKLDQYVMNGGKLLFFIDRLNAEMDSLQIKNEVVAYDRELGLNDLLFKYGVRVNADLVMDLQCDYLPFDVNGNGQFELLPWNYFPVLESRSNHPINKNLGFVAGQFVNSIDTVESGGTRKTILLSSSNNARIMGTPALISGKENVQAPQDEKFKKAGIPVAVLLEGKFTSLYENRLSGAMNDSLELYGEHFMPSSIKDNKMIVVSDGDLVLNGVVKGNQPIPMGMNRFTYGSQREFPFANKDFLKSCLDYLVNPHDLSEAKGKDYVVRLLDSKKLTAEKRYWQALDLLVPVLAVILFAAIFQWLRRRKYSKPAKSKIAELK